MHQSVDPERNQCQHEEQHDDYYRYHIIFLGHFGGVLYITFSGKEEVEEG
jgi:hypothetical protein